MAPLEKHDKALMKTWKDDLRRILIFSGLFSVILTAFIVNTSKRLKAEKTNALLIQNILLLAQILRQVNSKDYQTVPQPFKPNPSDLRVYYLWYISLFFNLMAAFCATLVHHWISNYLQFIQPLGSPLERPRVHQFLFEGLDRYRMYKLIKYISTLIYISLFLFFVGFIDYAMN
ncbi:hypothetical protein BYT27DRAFT_7152349 [Phlegmacium glaucopus]|nr:hypothetical protein BYT27DRAFT_7152349 [Phlegmacium glaucopus]